MIKKIIIYIYVTLMRLKAFVFYKTYNAISFIKLLFLRKLEICNVNKKNKKTIVLLMHKYIRNTQMSSNEIYNVLKSLQNSFGDEIDIHPIYYEIDFDSTHSKDVIAIEKILKINPDYFIISSYNGSNIKQPSISVMRYIRKRLLHTKFINFLWDTASHSTYKNYKKVFDISDLSIVIDGSNFYYKYKDKLNLIQSYTPQDQTIYYYDKNMQKDIDVLFLGSISSYRSTRKEYLDFLKDSGINITIGGGGIDNPISAEEYAKLTQRAKIVINFSASVNDEHQLKGRVFESILCGALLLESTNDITSKYFDVGIDYIEYSDKTDLLNKVKYYLENNDERIEISNNAYDKVMKTYNDFTFWKRIFKSTKE